jgi:hypothetical protein
MAGCSKVADLTETIRYPQIDSQPAPGCLQAPINPGGRTIGSATQLFAPTWPWGGSD